ncbi:MAG: aminotransferase class I/II-fold pyridoxal phosphate-dependent enzyme [Gloeocapsa sp. DLM2.Bin57]|nr:MAG: aminotransferase class I/II-fold pyridoxal phosphate-dependent enzyme [Gloeocapsa sp. DLM2.Bin57]
MVIKNQLKTPIIEQLGILSTQPDAAFYAPGHKRGQGINPLLADLLGHQVFKADLPELPELDNLFAPTGVIAEAQSLAAAAFGASQTWFLVNGSTCGIIAAILATCQEGDKIILPRNSHRSVISGLILSGAMPIFIQPEYNPQWDLVSSITPEAIASTLAQHPDAKAVMVVYPTYQGICTDLASIVQITHSYNIPLLVDEAHGAHLHFHPDLPPSAMSRGADLSVQSAHKTLGALSQASLLHLQGNRINADALNQALGLVQSTSPSYLLLASLDAARQQMAIQGEQLLTHTLHLTQLAKNDLNKLSRLNILTQEYLSSHYQLDSTRLTVLLPDSPLSGYEADTILRNQYNVTPELPLKKSLTFIFSIGNTQTDIHALTLGLQRLEQNLPQKSQDEPRLPYSFPILTQSKTPRAAFFAHKRVQPLTESVGEISAELICPYPPGIPILLPGEKITSEAISYLLEVKKNGAIITGCQDESLEQITTVI